VIALASRLSRALGFDHRHLRDRRFWIVQLLVVALAAGHTVVEVLEVLPHGASLYFVPETLFLVPVGYAALNFGLHGAVATALWCTALALPNLVVFHHGDQFAAAATQLLIVNAVAFFVGHRVEEEVLARRQVDETLTALRASEQRFRGLFDSSAAGVLVFDRGGRIHEANAAAARLFGRDDVHRSALPDIVGPTAADHLLETASASMSAAISPPPFAVARPGGTEVLLEPASTAFTGPDGRTFIQTLLHDVTAQHRRQTQLRAYAGRILQAQDEERRRIAQELHDETLQRVVVLCRQLHEIEEALAAHAPRAAMPLRLATRTAEDLMAELREFTRQLRPPALDELGVVTCLRRMVSDLTEQSGIDGALSVRGLERRLEGALELGVFRIAQESLRNVERHAEASRLRLGLAFEPGRVELTIVDDGKGFCLPATVAHGAGGGLGLLGMQERAALLGGELEIVTSPGQGTRVIASMPG
jgi:PAS domain S-box-containing protein